MNTRRVALAAGIDVSATLVFVLTGRGSHHEDTSLVGFLTTGWPFIAALAIGWAVTVAWRRPFGVLWPGVGIWLVTVAGGMLFRTLSGQGTAAPFLIVTTVALGLLLVGWRAVARFLLLRRAASAGGRRKTERYS